MTAAVRFWFVTAPSWLWGRLGEGGIPSRAVALAVLICYGLVTLLAAGFLLRGVAAAAKSAGRAIVGRRAGGGS